MLVLILFLTLAALFIFMSGRVFYRKRQVDEVYKKVNALLLMRNQQLANQLNSNSLLQTDKTLSSVEKLLNQSAEDELDMFETIAIENRINRFFDDPFLNQLSKNESTQPLYNTIINSNIQFKEAREAFNMAATYHNYSVEYFPTKTLSKLLGYKTVPQLTYPNNIPVDFDPAI